MNLRAFIFLVVLLPTLLNTFKVYWNIPSATCRTKYDIDFRKYKIETNRNLSFYGDKVVIFYEFVFGTYPYYKGYKENQPVNGGTPQNCSLEQHLEIIKKNITERIPDENFDGLAIVDLEEWRPLFDENFYGLKRVFRNQSIALARINNIGIHNESEIESIAEKDFNDAARNFFVKTIQMGRELRPHALWGFYGFPYCNYNAGQNGEYECSKPYRDWNDRFLLGRVYFLGNTLLRNSLSIFFFFSTILKNFLDNYHVESMISFRMMFIFNESSALYPSIYLGFNATSDQRFRYVQAILREARRVANKFTPPLPIYAYSKIEYNPLKEIADFYDTRDLCSTIKQPADLGIDGIIFWSSSNNMTLRCPYIKDNMEKVIGPKVRTIISQQDACGKIRCRSNGKCVLPTNTTCQDFNMNTNLYKCECNEGFSGEDCSVQNTDGVAVAPQRSGRSATLKRVIHLS